MQKIVVGSKSGLLQTYDEHRIDHVGMSGELWIASLDGKSLTIFAPDAWHVVWSEKS